MPIGDVAPEIALILGAAATLLLAMFVPRRLQWLGAPAALLALTVAAALELLAWEPSVQTLTFSGTWAVDGTATFAKLLILAATAVVVGLSPEWMASDRRHGEYYAIVLFACLGAVAMASAADTMELMVAVLLSSATGYVLAAYHRRSALSAEAGVKFFLIGGLTNALLLLGIVLLYGVVTTTLYEAVPGVGGSSAVVWVAAVGLIAVGLAFEAGAVPAHAWLPDVAQGAPAPSAAFLTVVPKIGALVAFIRLFELLPADLVGWRPLAAVLAAVTMTLGNLAAVWQEDLRRLLGWSSVSQAGYALMAVVAVGRSELAVPALLYFLAGYSAANLAAFGIVTELRGRTAMEAYAGLGRQRPWLAAGLVVALLSLVGIPPLVGFTGKLTLFAATIEAGYTWLAVLAVVNTVLSLFYYLRVIGPMYLDPAPGPVPVLGRIAGGSALLTAGLVVVLGLAAQPLLEAFRGALLLP